jgi:hypothetical protein
MRPSHNIGAEYTMVYSIRDVTRGQTPVMGAVIYFIYRYFYVYYNI